MVLGQPSLALGLIQLRQLRSSELKASRDTCHSDSSSSASVFILFYFLHDVCQTLTMMGQCISSSPAAVVLTPVSVVCCHFCIVCVGGWAGFGGCMMFDSMLTGLTAGAKHD